jgi:hypothetical protein
VFSVWYVPRNYKRAEPRELKEYKGVIKKVQSEVGIVPVECPVGR